MLRPFRRLRQLKRYRQILTRLAFYGFAELAGTLGLGRRRVLSFSMRRIGRGRKIRRLPYGTRLRLLLEDLGPTYIKLGQLFSLRSDLIPEELANELSRLQYQAAPLPFEQLVPVLEEALGASWRERFRSVDETPLASASVAQVHRAVTRRGRKVVLKIQRPGIEEIIRADLSILADLAALLERVAPRSRIYRPVSLIEHFSRVLTLELDFNYEARTMDLVREQFRREAGLHIPEVEWELSSRRLLVMEYIPGVRLSDTERFARARLDTRRVAELGARYVLAQVFEHGIYNADPHPANFIVRDDGVLVPIDFGMVGILDEELKQALVGMLLSFVNRDTEKLMRVFSSLDLLTEVTPRTRRELATELSRLLQYYHHLPVARLSAGRMLQDLIAVVRRFHLPLPVDLALTLKVLITLESLARRLDPGFDVITVARPFLTRMRRRRLHDWTDWDTLIDLLEDSGRMLRALPGDLHELVSKASTGRLKLSLDLTDLDQRVREIDRSVNRLSFAVVIAGILIGSSFFLRGVAQPLVLGLPVFGLLGFGAAVVLGVWFLLGILRSGRL